MDIKGQSTVFDGALMGILQSCRKLQDFLDIIFSFLARRTDFYIIMKHDRAKMGFPPGTADDMVQAAYRKFEILTRKREAEIMREEETKKVEKMVPAPTTVEVTTDIGEDELPINVPTDNEDPEEDVEPPKPATTPAETMEKKPPKMTPESKKERTTAFNYTSDVYNGADMDDYKWSQTITELEIKVPLSDSTTAKQVKVDIRSDYLKVELLQPEYKVVLDGKLTHKVKVDDSMWNVDRESATLYINLEKGQEIMWKAVMEGDKGIDLTKVDNVRSITEFDPETQAAVQRVQYDHHMKMQGRPTSSDKKAHEILRKAWNAEGSPFKGTPFDPSRVQISGSFD